MVLYTQIWQEQTSISITSSTCASPGKSSDDAIDKVLNGWLQWAGAPVEIHTDSGTEFTSKEFVTFLGQFNIKAIVTPPGAHWQIGKVERHGGILQEMLTLFMA